MRELTIPINDVKILSARYILREGFPFTSITAPANIYDAIIIKPCGEKSFSPQFPTFNHSIDDYISFVNKHGLKKALVIANDIAFLEKCPTLKYLTIIPSDSASENFDFSPLYKLTGLLYLRCHTEYGYNFKKSSTIDYSSISELLMLDISGSGHLNSNRIKTLKTLSVAEYKEKNLYNLFGSECLETMQIINSSIKDLSGIERSTKLQCLELFYNRCLEDISSLEATSTTLKSLDIKNCSKIRDFSVIERLEKLEFLALYGSNNLPDLTFLKKLKNLKAFGFDVNILNGDLTPCLSLERAFCARVRKHYNLKNLDLPQNTISSNIGYEGIDAWRRF